MKNSDKQIGNTEPYCPYCLEQLAKMPSRKSRCPNCNNYYYIRTRPADNRKILVTEAQAIQVEELWAIKNGTYDQLMAERRAFTDEKSRLTKKYKTEPSENDVKWSLLNKQLMETAKERNWGLYRNTRFDMAEILRKEGKLESALSTYLEICYLDINGPRNLGGFRNNQIPSFSPDEAFLAPGIIKRALSIMKKLNISEARTKAIFAEIASLNHDNLKLPVSPDEAWINLRKDLFSK